MKFVFADSLDFVDPAFDFVADRIGVGRAVHRDDQFPHEFLEEAINADPSRRVHGHSYRAEVTVRGEAYAETGMVVDLSLFEQALSAARDGLDHQFLNYVPELGPATIENLAVWIGRVLAPRCVGLARVTVYRDASGDACSYFGPQEPAHG